MFRDLEQVAPHVWIYPHSTAPGTTQPNVGIIKAQDRTVLIDAGNGPRHARYIRDELITPIYGPVDTLIYTHHHWDHVFGAIEFNARHVIAHEKALAPLQQMAHRSWSTTGLREEIYRNPRLELRNSAIERAVDDWRSFKLVMPTMTFSHQLTRYIEDLRFELEHVGGTHAPDSIIVRLPQLGVVFVGDAYYPPPYHERTSETNDLLDVAMLERIADPAYTVYVDGHGAPRSYEEFCAMIAAERVRQTI